MEPPKLLNLGKHVHFPKWFPWKGMTGSVKQWEPEKLTCLLETKLFKKLFFFLFLCLLFSQAWFKLFYFNTLESFIFFTPHSITILSAELVQAWKTESQQWLKNGHFYLASGFCSIFFFSFFFFFSSLLPALLLLLVSGSCLCKVLSAALNPSWDQHLTRSGF